MDPPRFYWIPTQEKRKSHVWYSYTVLDEYSANSGCTISHLKFPVDNAEGLRVYEGVVSSVSAGMASAVRKCIVGTPSKIDKHVAADG